jgi:hypothetical protein
MSADRKVEREKHALEVDVVCGGCESHDSRIQSLLTTDDIGGNRLQKQGGVVDFVEGKGGGGGQRDRAREGGVVAKAAADGVTGGEVGL